MDVKRIFRGPWLWIVVAVVGVLIALQYLAPNGGYTEVPTSKMSSYLQGDQVKEVLFVDGADVVTQVHDVLSRMGAFADSVRDGSWRGATGSGGGCGSRARWRSCATRRGGSAS